jgi:protein-tyrosine-phosphatase
MKHVPRILFVCIHNAGRSQMAAAFAREAGGAQVEILSAGSEPADALNPVVVEAMLERGIDINSETPKLLSDAMPRIADVIITMGCGDTCPVYPGKQYRDWSLNDPAGQTLEEVRKIRDEIEKLVLNLFLELKIVRV